ncbi:MAG: glutamate racemase [Candidatus Zhuqueibacterota bacterium]
MKRVWSLLLCLAIILMLTLQCSKKKDIHVMVNEFFQADTDVTILVTDSGLGGLSVAAELAARLPQSGVFENVRIIFYNSQYHDYYGYNSLKNESEKVRIFDSALKAMKKSYHPDMLLIACNTLSVLYDKTGFAQRANYPVIGIVELGVDLMEQEFERQPEATVLIFATETTIGSGAHKKLLIERGIPAERIIGQSCPRLAGRIEEGPASEETIGLITKYVGKALDKLGAEPVPIFASLNCTHFGYSMQQFSDAFAAAGHAGIRIIDPNPSMAALLFKPEFMHRFPATNVSVEVVSKGKLGEKEINSISSLLEKTSPQTADALRRYEHRPDLFEAVFDSTMLK